MRKLFLISKLTLIACTFILTSQCLAQTANNVSRESLTRAIKERAHRDVEFNKSPESPQGLNLLFGRDAESVGLTLREVVIMYEDEYSATKKQTSKSEAFRPDIGWITAFFLFLLLIFRDALKDTLTKLTKYATEWSYNKLAGYKALRRTALRRYRYALIRKYRKLKIPFRPDQSLDLREIYVPLKVRGTSNSNVSESSQVVANYQRIMVLGPPGSGKTMLIKHIALAYAEGRLSYFTEQPTPIVFELARLNEADKSIKDHLVEILEANDFPRADNFVKYGLEHGTLLLLFDGLDEISASNRTKAIEKISDLLDKYSKCRSVITCRNAVYRAEYCELGEQTFEIVEFNDQQIRRFLEAREQDLPPGKSIDQLILTLRERPRIMTLARNPLLLTMIALLYTGEDFVLPHSRAEFYDQAIDLLLRQWHGENNHYMAPYKKLVLQHLALFNQDSGSEKQQDRKSIDHQTILKEIRRVLTELSMDEKEARPLLDEITERSGLLLLVDGGEGYQFAHLTLQEFFSATALRTNVHGLLTRFVNDRDTWRETIKLWCGLDQDSTEVIQHIKDLDPITAFECLADAQKVNPEVADQIVDIFKSRLGVEAENADAVMHAFAAVASGQSARSKAAFNYLADMLSAESDCHRRTTAAATLSLTNQPMAVQVLVKHYTAISEVRASLIRMGDLAVPALKTLATEGTKAAIDDLRAIGTPLAAEGLCSMLWTDDKEQVATAAWNLATLFRDPNVESRLREYKITQEEKTADRMHRVWEPFAEPPWSSLPLIAERISYILSTASIDALPGPNRHLDARLIIPVCSNIAETHVNLSKVDIGDISDKLTSPSLIANYSARLKELVGGKNRVNLKQAADIIEATSASPAMSDLRSHFISLILEQASKRLNYLLACVPQSIRDDWIFRLVRGPIPTFEDWINIFRPVKYQFSKGWHYRLLIASVALLSGFTLYWTASLIWRAPTLFSWNNIYLAAVGLALLLCWMIFMGWIGSDKMYDPEVFYWLFVGAPIYFLIGFFPIPLFKFLPTSWVDPRAHVFTLLIIVLALISVCIYVALARTIYSKSELEYRDAELKTESAFPPTYVDVILTMIVLTLCGGVMYYVALTFTKVLMLSFSRVTVAFVWLALIGVWITLWLTGKRRDRIARNPLSGILDFDIRYRDSKRVKEFSSHLGSAN